MNDSLSRRGFLQAGAAATLASIATPRSLSAQDARPPRVDAHLHCFAGTGDARFPYHEKAPYRPADKATPEQLLAVMREAGVDHAVVVHPEPYQDDHRYLEHCLTVGKGKLKGTLLVFCDREGSLERLPELRKRLDVVAVRVHAYAPERLRPFGKPELRRLWQLAGENQLAVQLHFEPRFAPGFEPLIREFKETRVIIDHMGHPFQGSPEEHAVVIGWSKYPNTVMKLSSIPAATTYPHRDIGPVVRRLTDAWGADRMIYGGGFGADATGASYAGAFARTASFLAHLSAENQAKILGGTAAKLFRFGA
jgi:predicted TIM-barrel fold metal-dependent hydrolase